MSISSFIINSSIICIQFISISWDKPSICNSRGAQYFRNEPEEGDITELRLRCLYDLSSLHFPATPCFRDFCCMAGRKIYILNPYHWIVVKFQENTNRMHGLCAVIGLRGDTMNLLQHFKIWFKHKRLKKMHSEPDLRSASLVPWS